MSKYHVCSMMFLALWCFILLPGLVRAVPEPEILVTDYTLISSDPQDRSIPDVTATINLHDTTHVAGFSVEFGFLFMTGAPDEFYSTSMGLAPRPDRDDGQSVVRATFKSWHPDSATNDTNCYYSDTDSGAPLVVCSVDIVTSYHHTVNLRVQRFSNSVWFATAIDTVTGKYTYIGSIVLPPSISGIWPGKLEGYSILYFFEEDTDYPCDKLPWLHVDLGTPSTSAEFADPSMLPPIEYGPCERRMNYKALQTESGYTISLGFQVPGVDGIDPAELLAFSVEDQIVIA